VRRLTGGSATDAGPPRPGAPDPYEVFAVRSKVSDGRPPCHEPAEIADAGWFALRRHAGRRATDYFMRLSRNRAERARNPTMFSRCDSEWPSLPATMYSTGTERARIALTIRSDSERGTRGSLAPA
jgi:hypothetical protein